ncbi:MAG: hypothetical protein ACF8CQ_15060, partial [Rhodopirellula sp. JB044]|uniref:hypothetical protein n=1 Tax=Rhodopirellula sp. JB044 TaxID=3342844 RepID=UPI00370B960E
GDGNSWGDRTHRQYSLSRGQVDRLGLTLVPLSASDSLFSSHRNCLMERENEIFPVNGGTSSDRRLQKMSTYRVSLTGR